jgi:outer membrane protein OmpA-like peptidoglycan-associated protein
MRRVIKGLALLVIVCVFLLHSDVGATVALQVKKNRGAQPRKIKLSGTVTGNQSDRLIVLDSRNQQRVVRKTGTTRYIKTQRRSGQVANQNNVVGGLYVYVIGILGDNDEVIAEQITFSDRDLRVAMTIEARVAALEERTIDVEKKVSEVEGSSQRIAGQLDELAAVSNAARGGGKAAQATADAAVSGVNATNDRMTAVDDYTVDRVITISFPVNSALITDQAKGQLQALGSELSQLKGYLVEVAGFGDKTGTSEKNIAISQERADAVAQYLARNGLVPVRRLLWPVGYGTRDSSQAAGIGRVEIRILLNKGLTAPAPTMSPGVSP